ncbi:hypothetical protein COV11_00845 [Candidatus Woesearchaeota archaeon CG10_big_fil_rev_8_21_14_0_10_30_7]|nr:MAG: hypothetical protein COV11_00845 [Candidatus Woesearchaeota archaeon CG10_big_fil_rev_8_21_14_0_10_30_7]
MVEKTRCEICDKEFNSEDSLNMHNKSKHFELYKPPKKKLTSQQKKKIRNWLIFLVFAILLGWGLFVSIKNNQSKVDLSVELSEGKKSEVPSGSVHWHPKISIIIDGEQVSIPSDLGYGTGKMVDTHLSGMRMSPIHTHDSGGTIHLENNNPSSKPETLSLGYFFYVWNKTFNSTCIFEYCTDKGSLKLFVNGKENFEFENYLMRDKDQIRIEYKSLTK